MKLSIQIGGGYAVVIVLVVGTLIYQSWVNYRIQSINRDLARVGFDASNLARQLHQDLDLIEEFTRKSFASADPGFEQQRRAFEELFLHDLTRIGALRVSPREKAQIENLSVTWSRYRAVPARAVADAGRDQVLSSQLDHLKELRRQTEEFIQTTQDTIASQVRRAAGMGERAQWISLASGVMAVLGSVLICSVIVGSVSRRLDELTRGTQAIAGGDFTHRISTSGTNEFTELAKHFNSMARRLNELDQMKKDFLSHISHELKTPLGSIQETVRLLLEELPGPLTPDQKRLLELNLQSSERLALMIRNLLDLSRIEAGMMDYQLETQDLVALARSAVEEFEPQLRGRRLLIEKRFPDSTVAVRCDANSVLQALGNLLDNARKFSPEDACIEVEIKLEKVPPPELPPYLMWRLPWAASGYALLAILDRGPGVPDPHKEKIFEKFHQIEPARKLRGQGVGLGLAICRSLIEAQRGVVWVTDRPGGGSVFNVLLPRQESEEGVV